MSGQAPSASNTAERIEEFLTHFRFRDIPDSAREIAKLHVVDGLACMLGGVQEDAAKLLHRHILKNHSAKQSTIVGTRHKTSAEQAALVNGVQAHVLDYDDAQLATLPSRPAGQQVHPTAPVLAAALALAEAKGLSGKALLTAYIAGLEVACRLGDAIDPSHYLDGFHPTGTLGVFGAAAACTHLLQSNQEQTHCALGIAGTLACGLRTHRGTMAKALSAGRAAQSGVLAAILAKNEFTASANVFDDAMGFFSAAAKNQIDRKLLRFGQPLFLEQPGIAIKLYPCPGTLHPALDAVIDLVTRHDVRADQVAAIRVSLNATAALPLVYPDPKTPLEAKFSLPFAMAVAVVERAAGLDQFSDRPLKDRTVRELMQQVQLVRRKSGTASEIELTLRSGHKLHGQASIARGHPKLPATKEQIEHKFRQCAQAALPSGTAETFLRGTWDFDAMPSVRKWLAPLRPKRR